MYPYPRIASVLALLLLLPLAPVAADAGRLVDVRRDARASVGATEANITRLIADLLQQSQFTHRPLDFELASAFLDRYLSVLDSDRLLFLQSDVNEFSIHRATLANDTRRSGDTRVAHAIFARYLERLGQRVEFITEALARDDFDFAKDASYRLDRTEAERPRNLAHARDLWRQRLMVDYLQEKLDDGAPEQIATTLRRRAERSLQAMQQMSRDAVLEVYLSALAHVYDPHSDYLGHEQLQEFAIGMNLSLFGIGAKLQSEDGFCKLVELVPGGPAERSELLSPGDRIVAVAQGDEEPVDVIELPLTRIVQLIRGPKGSVVKLTVIPAGAGDNALRKTVRLVRDEIKLEERRAKARIIDLPQAPGSTLRLGVIDLPSFYSSFADGRGGGRRGAPGISATDDVARLLERLVAENVQGVILDLRRNGGGVLEEAIRLTGLFITQGPVVQTRGPQGAVEVGVDDDPALVYGGPLIVLTSRFSASASEIVAGALQDYDRALIVGDPSTFGKGTVQSVVRLGPIMNRMGLRTSYDPGALTLTIRKFYRPSGASTQLEGVVPHIVLPSTNSPEIGESALDNPLPWDTVSPTDYPRLQMVRGYLPALRAESAHRVATAQDFAYLKGEMERIARQRADRTVSLNESVRRRELAEIERRRNELELALSSAGEIAAVRYELSINDLARPGLPPPMPPAAERLASEARAAGAGNADQADGPAPRDVVLLETKRILADYVMLLDDGAGSRTRPMAARPPREAAVH